MHFEIIELYQEDCPNIALTEKISDLNILILDVQTSCNKETLRAYIFGKESKNSIDKLVSSNRVFKLDIHSKSRDGIEAVYDIAITRAWRIIHNFGGKVICPIVVYNDLEKWFVIWEDFKKRKKAINELKKTEFTRVKRSYEIEPYVFSRMLIDIEGLSYMIKELSNLTTVQLSSLKEAYQNGLYDIPRKTTLKVLSKRSGISKTAYVKRLKSAEKKIISGVLEFFKLH